MVVVGKHGQLVDVGWREAHAVRAANAASAREEPLATCRMPCDRSHHAEEGGRVGIVVLVL
eukprot:51347-Eustigmatos_ZCMA.PRE.1